MNDDPPSQLQMRHVIFSQLHVLVPLLVATPYGNECLDSDLGCSNSWENRASESPRCQIINVGSIFDDDLYDWCLRDFCKIINVL